MSSIAVITTQANRIRAAAVANPQLSPRLLAAKIGVHHHLVELALGQGDRRRPKSVAK